MKKSVILLGLAAMVSAFTGCSKDVDAGVSGNVDNMPAAQSGVLVASLPGDAATRLALGEDGVSTTWSEGDRIGLYSTDPSNKLIAFDIMPENVGTSSATFVVNDNDAAAWEEATLLATSIPVSLENQVVAIYPYDGALVESPMGDFSKMVRIGGTIPSTQKYVENSFDPASMPMIAMTKRTEGTTGPDTFESMKFVHLGAMLKLQLTAPEAMTLDKISVSGLLIAGTAYVDFSDGVSETVLDALQNGTSLGLPDGYFGANSYQSKITVEGPIEVNADGTTNVYIAILANKASSLGTLTFSFYKDGEEGAFASRSVAMRDVKAGELVTIQSLSLGAGEAPVLTVDDVTPTLVSWQELEGVKNLTLTLTQNDKVVYSDYLDPTATSVNIADLPLTSVISSGEVNFTLDVEYASAFGASASTTMTLWSAIIPAPVVTVNGNVVTISNANAGYDEIAWAYLSGAGVTDENEFSGFTTEGINNGAIDLSSLTPGDYSVCVRGNVGGFLGTNVYTCVDVTVTEYVGPTYDVEISASMEGKVLTITVTKGADIVQEYMDKYNLSVLISGFEVGLYDGWTVDQQSISVDLTGNLNWGDIKKGVNTISLGAYPEGQWSASPISNEVSVNIE